jgi:NADPH2:quinone reductase
MVKKNVRRITMSETGKAEVMKFESVDLPEVGDNELEINQKALGLNFIDIYHRSGVYPLPTPTGLGLEAAGVIAKIGEKVNHLKIGDRVAYASNPIGAYCESRVMPAAQVCKLPDSISLEEGAAMMLKGLTVQYLFHSTTPIKKDSTVLFHAGAGGVGLIACQWAKSEGIKLIATAGSQEKCDLASQFGATHTINYKTQNFTSRVRDLTNGEGVDVVMDSIGKDTFEGSLDCLKPLGMMISFGNTSGKVPPFDIGLLQSKGSLKITRPTLFNPHLANHENCQKMANHLFKKVLSKEVIINIGQEFHFDDIVEAHRAIESGQTSGSTVIKL